MMDPGNVVVAGHFARLEPVGVSEGETVEYLECTGCGGIVQRGQFAKLPSGRRAVLRYCPNCGAKVISE